jgi:thiamine biosynthesis protein ThiS
MKIFINDEEVVLEKQINIEDLLNKFSLDKRKIAIEKNLEIVSQSQFSDVFVNEGDRIEIIHFIGGG